MRRNQKKIAYCNGKSVFHPLNIKKV